MTTYIPRELLKNKIQKISDRYESPYGLMKGGHKTACEEIKEALDSLPSLQDQVVELIEKKIEENRYEVYMEWYETNTVKYQYEILEELLSEIKLLNN